MYLLLDEVAGCLRQTLIKFYHTVTGSLLACNLTRFAFMYVWEIL